MQNELLKEALGKKAVRLSQHKKIAQRAVRDRSVSIRFACRKFSISETCYRYHPKISDKNELIADWLVSLTDPKKAWGFGQCFMHLPSVKGFLDRNCIGLRSN